MTGPEHFRAAEEDLKGASEGGIRPDLERFLLARAQIHATLANAAATALNDADGGSPREEWHRWRVAAGYPAKADRDFVAGQAAIEAGEARPR